MKTSEKRIKELEDLQQKVLDDRKIIEEAIKTLKLKANEDHMMVGQVLSKYVDTLSKLNQQLIEIEKLIMTKDKPDSAASDKENEKNQKMLLSEEVKEVSFS